MKKVLLFLVGYVVSTIPTFANGFHSVHSPNGLDVWAVGNNGLVFHSVNGGVTWSSFSLGSTTLRSVYANGSRLFVVGDNGKFYVTTNGGSTWDIQTLAGGITLRSITFSDTETGLIAGDNGTILQTSDGGTSWAAKVSNTTQNLYSITFVNTLIGYAGGAGGVLLKTTDGGNAWTNIAPSVWTKNILSVSASGMAVYIAGVDEFCYRSSDGGTSWTELNLKTDTHSDVNAVFAVTPTHAYFVGGGGYIRVTTDSGRSYDYGIHQMHAKLNAIFFYNATIGWACSEKNNAVLRTTDGGSTWQLPQGTTVSYSWSQRLSGGNSTGNPFCVNPWNKERLYVAAGSTIYLSVDRGDTWTATASVSGSSSTRSFYISPKDTNLWVVAHQNAIKRSTNRGASWTTTIARNYTSYGMPLEMDPDHPDTLLFAPDGTAGPNGIVYRSTNFGATWDTLAQTNFRSPCDIVIVPGKTETIYVGDGVTGSGQAQMWKSVDGGRSWTSIYTVSGSEIPMISISRLRNMVAFATAWSSGGFWKTSNFGDNWTPIASTGSTWGTDVAKDDPNIVMYGVYGGGTSYLSTNSGTSFTTSSLTGSNTAILCYDRATFLALQTGALWKYIITYTVPVTNVQTIALLSPNGGENWAYNSVQNINWISGNISNVRIEYRTGPAEPWLLIASNVSASLGTYAWTVPNTPTNEARVRIGDASDGDPAATSSGNFSITVANISTTPESLAFGNVQVGQVRQDTLRIFNSGTGTLVVTSVVTNTPYFIAGRTSFNILPGASDTLSVLFMPSEELIYTDTLIITSNAVGSPTRIPLSGTGEPPVSVVEVGGVPSGYELDQNYPNPFNPTTTITFGVPTESYVTLKVYNMLGQQVAWLSDGLYHAGRFQVIFDASHLPSGLYFYRLRASDVSSGESFVNTKRLALLK
jgi:photosystem II stability/assembly factor-like uncharacterized protein